MFKSSLKIGHMLTCASVLATCISLTPAYAGSLENLERERANLIDTLLDPALSPDQRLEKVSQIKSRLVDMERIVLRDDSLSEVNSPAVHQAFQNYDLTFLVHGAIEKDVTLIELWMEELGLSSNATLNARMGRR